jgi:outer membrane protein assembly factor BamB
MVWRKPLPARAESSPLYHDGRIYFGTESGDFFAMRTRDGKTVWRSKLAGSVKAAPAYLGGSLYVGDYAGDMYSIRASDGRIRWRASSLGGSFGRGGRFYSTPAVAFGRVYAGNVDGRVYSFARRTGEVAWTRSASHFVYSGIAAADTKRTRPTVYYGSHDANFYAVDARTGQARWSARAGGQISGPATVIGQIAYASTFSGRATVGFDVETGRRRFKVGIGQYGPSVSDGVRLYIVGGGEIRAYDPVKNVPGTVKGKESSLGVLSTKAYRKAKLGGKPGGKPGPSPPQRTRKRGSGRGRGERPAKAGRRSAPRPSAPFESGAFGLEPAG